MTDTVVKHDRAAVEALVEEGRAALASDDEGALALWVLKVKDFERRESDVWLNNEGPSLSTNTLNDLAIAPGEEGVEPTPEEWRRCLAGVHATLAQLLSAAEFADEMA